MHEALGREAARIRLAEASGVGDRPLGHEAMRFEQVVDGMRIEFIDEGVRRLRIADLEDARRRTECAQAVEGRDDGLEVEAVPLDEERGAECPDAQLAMRARVALEGRTGRDGSDELGDPHREVVDSGRSSQRRLIGHGAPRVTDGSAVAARRGVIAGRGAQGGVTRIIWLVVKSGRSPSSIKGWECALVLVPLLRRIVHRLF